MKTVIERLGKLVLLGFLIGFSMSCLTFDIASAAGNNTADAGDTDVSIKFVEGPQVDKPKAPKDDTPKIGKGKVVNRQPNLPQTGEVAKQLTLFLTGLILLVIVFVWFTNKQFELDEENP